MDISIDSAIKGCLTNGETFADKVKAAYNKAFGNDYDFDDLADAGGADSDSDGLPDSFEGIKLLNIKQENKIPMIQKMRPNSTRRWAGLMGPLLRLMLSRLT